MFFPGHPKGPCFFLLPIAADGRSDGRIGVVRSQRSDWKCDWFGFDEAGRFVYCGNSVKSVVNDVLMEYNSFGQLLGDYQAHSGSASTGSPGAQYAYANGSANTVRPTSLTYPSGRVLNYNYGSSGGMNDLLSRIGSLIDNDGTTHLVDYTYVGANRTVVASSPQPGTELTYIKLTGEPNGDGGDQYTGWDRFSRVIDQRWVTTSTGTALERVQYGFDQASNRIWRDNLVADGTSADQDEYYTYDGLYQLAMLQRGQLNGGKTGITGTPTWEEDFTMDPTGNWDNYKNKTSGTTTLNQNRTYDKANDLLTIAASSAYINVNAAGNTTVAPVPGSWTSAYNLTYDAWQRPVKVATPASSSSSTSSSSSSSGSTVATYGYDGLDRRVTKTTGSVRHYYYSNKWQILEERVGSSTSADRQFVWGQRYTDDLVLRDQSTTRLYAFHDYFSCTAVADTTGTVQERYGYNAFGQPRVMTPTFGSRASSSYTWETLFDAYRWDSETGLYQVRFRYLHPNLGRWLTRDPLYLPGFDLRGGNLSNENWSNGDTIANATFRVQRFTIINFSIENSQNSNLYWSFDNSPITNIDKNGTIILIICCIIAGVVICGSGCRKSAPAPPKKPNPPAPPPPSCPAPAPAPPPPCPGFKSQWQNPPKIPPYPLAKHTLCLGVYNQCMDDCKANYGPAGDPPNDTDACLNQCKADCKMNLTKCIS
jgi:RHS repeat-associated protein